MNIDVIIEQNGVDILLDKISLTMLGGVLRAFLTRQSLTIRTPNKPFTNFY